MKKPSHKTFHGRLDLERPYCASIIGAIAMSWSFFEQVLALHFATLVMGGKGGADGRTYEIALESFDASQSVSQKRDLFLIAARRRFDEPTIAMLQTHLNKIVDLAVRRNRVIHGRWRLAPEYPNALLCDRRIGQPSTEPDVYDPARLDAVLAAILKAYDEFNRFCLAELFPLMSGMRTTRIHDPPPSS